MIPVTCARSQVYYIGQGCACIRTVCENVAIDSCIEETNATKFCACNFTKIIGCNFNYTIPVTTNQLIQDTYVLYHDIPDLQIGMKIEMLKKMYHPDLKKMIQEVNETSHQALRTDEHNVEKIKEIIPDTKKTEEHHWWEIFLVGMKWQAPRATQLFNILVHPVLVLLLTTALLTIVNLWRQREVRVVAQQVCIQWTMQKNLHNFKEKGDN